MTTWNGKYKSVKYILEKVYRDIKPIESVDLYDAVEWLGECIELIGSPFQLLDKHDCITIEEFKGKLPCDLFLLLGTREKNSKQAMRYSTDSFHHAKVCQDVNHDCYLADVTYTINDDYMFTSFKEGDVEIAYKAIPVDKEGFPMIPDDIKFVKAAVAYISERILYGKWTSGKVNADVYRKAEQERNWYIGAAQSRGNMPSVDMMESLKNQLIRLIPKINQHADNFKSTGEREQRISHNSIMGENNDQNRNVKGGEDTFFHFTDAAE